MDVDEAEEDAHNKALLVRVWNAWQFPQNTCAASRHVLQMAEALASGTPYLMLADEPKYCAGSMLATVAALYEARNEIEALKSRLIREGEEE